MWVTQFIVGVRSSNIRTMNHRKLVYQCPAAIILLKIRKSNTKLRHTTVLWVRQQWADYDQRLQQKESAKTGLVRCQNLDNISAACYLLTDKRDIETRTPTFTWWQITFHEYGRYLTSYSEIHGSIVGNVMLRETENKAGLRNRLPRSINLSLI